MPDEAMAGVGENRYVCFQLHDVLLVPVQGSGPQSCGQRRESRERAPRWCTNMGRSANEQESVGASALLRLERTHALLFPRQTACRLDHRQDGEERQGQASLLLRRCRTRSPCCRLFSGEGRARTVVVRDVGNRCGCLREKPEIRAGLRAADARVRDGRLRARVALMGKNWKAGAHMGKARVVVASPAIAWFAGLLLHRVIGRESDSAPCDADDTYHASPDTRASAPGRRTKQLSRRHSMTVAHRGRSVVKAA